MDDGPGELQVELMNAQIETLLAEREKLRAETDRFRQEMRWEPWKALVTIIAAILGASAAMTGAVLALAGWLSQHPHG
jgi:hypothetical protein